MTAVATHQDPGLLARAAHPDTEPHDLAMILLHTDQEVQPAVAQNPATSSDLLLNLRLSKNPQVRQAAFARRNRG